MVTLMMIFSAKAPKKRLGESVCVCEVKGKEGEKKKKKKRGFLENFGRSQLHKVKTLNLCCLVNLLSFYRVCCVSWLLCL
jgi:hypothetical protein